MQDRRELLQSISGATLLAPFIGLAQAIAATPIEKALGPKARGNEQIAMLLYPGFTALDLVGSYHFFSAMIGAKVHLVTTEDTLEPIASDYGLAIAPTKRMAEVNSSLDILFVPGGGMGTVNVTKRPEVIAFIKRQAAQSRWVSSVCTGAFLLGKAGLLDGKRATTHWLAKKHLVNFGAKPVDDRYVTDGNVITAAGISAGLDFGVALVAALRGEAYAQAVMLQAEYDPRPPIKGGSLGKTKPIVRDFMQGLNEKLSNAFGEIHKS